MNKRNGKRKRHPLWAAIEIVFGVLLGIWIAMTMRGIR